MNSTWLSRRWERLRTVPGLGRDVLALLGLVILGLTAATLIQSNLGGGNPFASHQKIRAEFAEVPGANPAAENLVTIAGVKVGQVSGWTATDRGTAVLTLEIESKHKIYANAQAVLRPKNPLNEMSVELNPGDPSSPRLRKGQVIPLTQTKRPIQADEVLGHLDERSQLALTTLLTESDVALARSADTLPAGLAATTETVTRFKPVMHGLESRRAKIAQLVSSLSQIIDAVGGNDARVTQLALATRETLQTLSANDLSIRESLSQLPGLADGLQAALSSTQELTKQLDPTLTDLSNASTSLPDALKRFESTVTQLGKTVDAAKPVAKNAKPVVADLRPLVADVDRSLLSLGPVTSKLGKDTSTVVSYLTDLQAFVYNTSSVFGAGDAEGSIIRGHVIVPLPGGGVLPNSPTQGRN